MQGPEGARGARGARGETGSIALRWKQEKVGEDFSRGQKEDGGVFARRSDDGVHRGWKEWPMQCLLGNSLGRGGQCG